MPRSPLFSKLVAAQAQLTIYHGWEIPSSFGSVEAEYWALKNGVGLLDLSHRGRLLVRGKDAPRFLHGMVTNEVQGLKIGQGNYAFLLDVHGHILADLQILRLEPESYLLDCEPQLYEVVFRALDRHIISDLVELEDRRDQLACLGLEGPCARQALRHAIGFDPPAMNVLEHFYREDLPVRVVRASLSGEEGYWILTPPERAAELWDAILGQRISSASVPAGPLSRQDGGATIRAHANNENGMAVKPAGFQAVEICRIEAGIPRYGIDVTEKNLPQETGQMHAISFTKGCYIGQEVVERIRSRGHVNRKLVRLLFEGRQEVSPQTEILFEGQPVGTTGSSAYSFGLQRTVALGYLRREYAEPGNHVTVGTIPSEVAELVPWSNDLLRP